MAEVGLGEVVSIGDEEEEVDLLIGVLLSEECDLERSEGDSGGGVPGRPSGRGPLPTVVTGGLPEPRPLLLFP